jgi:hypothetical protein
MKINHDSNLWREIFKADQKYVLDALGFWNEVTDKTSILHQALLLPHQRGAALRLLLLLDDELKKGLFQTLVDLASVGHSDIGLCRLVIKSISPAWVKQNIEVIASNLLDSGGDEEYRRLAELYQDIDKSMLARLVERALKHSDEMVREVGVDFSNSEDKFT